LNIYYGVKIAIWGLTETLAQSWGENRNW